MNEREIEQKKRLLEKCLSLNEHNAQEISTWALNMNADMSLSQELRSFSLDLMLLANQDFNGEYGSVLELVEALKK
jgi:hypothetical protein